MAKHENYDKWFEPARAVEAEGARIGVATCRVCGAAILLDPDDMTSTVRVHAEWHESRGEATPRSEGGER